MKAKHGKSTFFVVMMTLLLCGVLAIGATYAYGSYSSSRTVGNETAVDANEDYALDLMKWDDQGYVSLLHGVNGADPAAIFTSNTLWEPGKTEVVYLKVANTEVFDMDCRVVLDVDTSTFGNNLKYAVINDLQYNSENQPTSWNTFLNKASESGSLLLTKDLWNDNVLYEVKKLTKDNDKFFALAIHMDESATQPSDGSTMQLSMKFAVKIDADYKPGTSAESIAKQNVQSAG